MNKQTYSYLLPSPLNCTVNIFYINFPEEVLNINSLNRFIYQAHEVWKRYIPNIFNNSVINIWDSRRLDIPRNKYDNEGNIIEYGIGDADGLSFAGEKRIELNSRAIGTDNELKLTFWHELGHIIDFMMDGGNDPTDIMISEYNRIENAVNSDCKSSPFERMAEHLLEMLIGYGRGDFNSVQQIQGLHDMLFIWNPVYRFVKAIRSFNAKIKDISHHYLPWDFNYYACMFQTVYNENQKYWYYCNRYGWQEFFPAEKCWKYICKF